MKRLPKGKTAQVMGLRFFQTMYTADQMRKYADKAVSDEREACAKVCDRYVNSSSDHEAGTAMNIQDAIRARGQT